MPNPTVKLVYLTTHLIYFGSGYYGLPGYPVRLPCPVFDQLGNISFSTFEWQKKIISGRDNWSPVALVEWMESEWKQPIYTKEWSRRNAIVSLFSGALTIVDFKQPDEGWYRCNIIGRNPALVEVELFGSYMDINGNYLRDNDRHQ